MTALVYRAVLNHWSQFGKIETMEISGGVFLIGLLAICAIGVLAVRYIVPDDDSTDRFF